MAQDRPPAPQFPVDEVDPKTTIGSARDQQPFVEYFARAPPESGTKSTWPAPGPSRRRRSRPRRPLQKRAPCCCGCVVGVMWRNKYPTEDTRAA